MCQLHNNAEVKRDPTRTTTLRQRFEAEAKRRFAGLRRDIVNRIVNEDGFGLRTNRGQFEFERSADKVAAFMDWLTQAENEQILGVQRGTPTRVAAESAWTSTYVQTAYVRGLNQAAARLRQAGATVEQRWVDAAFRRPIHADRLGIAYTRTYTELKGITDVMDQQISRVLAQGLANGDGPPAIARAIVDRVDKIGITRARMLARTEVINAHAEAALNTYQEAGLEGVDVVAEWLTAVDACPECVALEAEGPYSIEQARGLIPVHPNCLPGDALVLSRTAIAGVSKRVFNGDMIVIKTASGRSLTCTPNHPVLTGLGWLPAQEINLGGQVICDGGREWEPSVDGDSDNVVARIHDVTEAFLSSGEVETRPVPTSSVHFHGDGTDGEVAIIGADRRLLVERQTPGGKLLKNEKLQTGGESLSGLLAESASTQVLLAPSHTSDGVVGGSDLSGSLLGTHVRPLEGLRLGLSTELDAGSGQARIDEAARDAELACELISGRACEVFADEVVSVDRFAFSGHVYNLETVGHWYSANGIITHNCRCAWAPLVRGGSGIELR